jgi:hypothetical protein
MGRQHSLDLLFECVLRRMCLRPSEVEAAGISPQFRYDVEVREIIDDVCYASLMSVDEYLYNKDVDLLFLAPASTPS